MWYLLAFIVVVLEPDSFHQKKITFPFRQAKRNKIQKNWLQKDENYGWTQWSQETKIQFILPSTRPYCSKWGIDSATQPYPIGLTTTEIRLRFEDTTYDKSIQNTNTNLILPRKANKAKRLIPKKQQRFTLRRRQSRSCEHTPPSASDNFTLQPKVEISSKVTKTQPTLPDLKNSWPIISHSLKITSLGPTSTLPATERPNV